MCNRRCAVQGHRSAKRPPDTTAHWVARAPDDAALLTHKLKDTRVTVSLAESPARSPPRRSGSKSPSRRSAAAAIGSESLPGQMHSPNLLGPCIVRAPSALDLCITCFTRSDSIVLHQAPPEQEPASGDPPLLSEHPHSAPSETGLCWVCDEGTVPVVCVEVEGVEGLEAGLGLPVVLVWGTA